MSDEEMMQMNRNLDFITLNQRDQRHRAGLKDFLEPNVIAMFLFLIILVFLSLFAH